MYCVDRLCHSAKFDLLVYENLDFVTTATAAETKLALSGKHASLHHSCHSCLNRTTIASYKIPPHTSTLPAVAGYQHTHYNLVETQTRCGSVSGSRFAVFGSTTFRAAEIVSATPAQPRRRVTASALAGSSGYCTSTQCSPVQQ